MKSRGDSRSLLGRDKERKAADFRNSGNPSLSSVTDGVTHQLERTCGLELSWESVHSDLPGREAARGYRCAVLYCLCR